MKKLLAKILFILSIAFFLCFIIKTVFDWVQYANEPFTSAPFYVFILLNFLYFILPSGALLTAGIILYRKK